MERMEVFIIVCIPKSVQAPLPKCGSKNGVDVTIYVFYKKENAFVLNDGFKFK